MKLTYLCGSSLSASDPSSGDCGGRVFPGGLSHHHQAGAGWGWRDQGAAGAGAQEPCHKAQTSPGWRWGQSESNHKKSTWLSSNISHHMPICETQRCSGLMPAPLCLCFVLGVQFMWDCCCESVKKIEKSAGSGCILAHCMGLGKTLQVLRQRENSVPFCCLGY